MSGDNYIDTHRGTNVIRVCNQLLSAASTSKPSGKYLMRSALSGSFGIPKPEFILHFPQSQRSAPATPLLTRKIAGGAHFAEVTGTTNYCGEIRG